MHGVKRFSNKVTVWIFPGNRSGLSFSFYPRRVVCGLGICSLMALAFLFARYGVSDPGQRLVRDESLKTLTEYLSRRAAELPGGQTSTKTIRADERVERRLQILADEYLRVRNYEKQLKERASLLNTVLQDALKLDRDSSILDLHEKEPDDLYGSDTENGVGGGDNSSVPVLGHYPKLSKKVFGESQNPRTVLGILDHQSSVISRIPLGVPVHGKKTSGFGRRSSPFSRYRMQFHRGIDYAIDRDTRVVATADGVVLKAGWERGLGLVVKIDHGNGIETVYGHLSRAAVKVGQKVCRGQRIGLVGNTGRSTGPHVHYEVLVGGVARDPEPYVQLASLLPFLKVGK